ncbi:hypothetical protein ATY41_06100 [Leifsonia xyli subsp. xyli]|uniref:Tox-REase-5 domain-containing protein n=2 Tax=Leifsonia xyli subsp. xyli TaxID=59736 RepID=Q6AC01_LEIXX|nr:Tox-REase-5 domain-containing protein [Leifsonia xyli]AAT90091.1 hypothetical protein Lxx24780 [Leifsonia xyli subsp. xyli str. CTCB07]ODA89290.1 hypothetical protein ATY41_06100 [Leifsonia xyli subsp. xyli]
MVGIPPGGLPKPTPEVWEGIGEFLTGFFGEAWDTVIGLGQLLPIVWVPQVVEELFTPEGWERQAQKWDAFINNPGGVLGDQWDQIWKSLTYADLWKDHPGQASGRATFAALTLALPFLKLGKVGKLGTVGKLGKADDIPKLRPLQPGEKLRLGETARVTSDGGPGLWEKSPTRTKGQDYQEFITGMERGTEYKVNGVDFDGYDKTRNVLLDAKDWQKYPPLNQTFWQEGTLEQIGNQIRAANGMRIEWHLSTQAAKDAVDKMLEKQGWTGDITTVYTPFG